MYLYFSSINNPWRSSQPCFPTTTTDGLPFVASTATNDFATSVKILVWLDLGKLRYLHLLTLNFQEFLLKLFNNWKIILLLLAWSQNWLLELLDLLLFPLELSFCHLEIDFENALFWGHILIHLVNLIKILLKILSFLFEFQIISAEWTF